MHAWLSHIRGETKSGGEEKLVVARESEGEFVERATLTITKYALMVWLQSGWVRQFKHARAALFGLATEEAATLGLARYATMHVGGG